MAHLQQFITFVRPCGRDNFKDFSCILLKLVMHAANNQFSDKFNKVTHFILWTDNYKRFSCFLLKFVLHDAINQFSSSSIMAVGYSGVCSCLYL